MDCGLETRSTVGTQRGLGATGVRWHQVYRTRFPFITLKPPELVRVLESQRTAIGTPGTGMDPESTETSCG